MSLIISNYLISLPLILIIAGVYLLDGIPFGDLKGLLSFLEKLKLWI